MVKPASPLRTSIEGFKRMAGSIYKERRDLESQSDTASNGGRRRLYWMLGTDLPLLIISLLILGLFEIGIIPANKSGFFCNDPALSHKFAGDTVGTAFLMITVLGLPILFMLPIEYIFVHPDYAGTARIRRALINTAYLYRTFLYGFFLNIGLVEVIKGLMGSPRPTFFDLCEPNTAKTCNGSEYVATYECTPNQYNWWYQSDSYRSFPSGHTSMSVYTAFFTAWYLQRRAFNWRNRSTFLVPFLQILLGSYAALCSLTRITDHRHHWWDVLVGSIIGFFTVVYAVVLSKNFAYEYSRPTNTRIKTPLR